MCVYDDEVLPNRGQYQSCEIDQAMFRDTEDGPGDPELLNNDWNASKAQINGTTVHITAIFGMTLSGLVIDDIYHKVVNS